jgi:hypothetical protein
MKKLYYIHTLHIAKYGYKSKIKVTLFTLIFLAVVTTLLPIILSINVSVYVVLIIIPTLLCVGYNLKN